MKKIYLIFLILFSYVCFAQIDTMHVFENKDLSTNVKSKRKQSSKIIKKPEFEGGMENFHAQFNKFFQLPYSAIDHKGPAGIILMFTIGRDGSIGYFKTTAIGTKEYIARDLIYEANRALAKMPKWIPAEKNGKIIKYKQVITIRLNIE